MFYWSNTKRKSLLVISLFLLFFLIFITCSREDETIPDAPADTVIKFTLKVTSKVGGNVSSSGDSYKQGKSI